MDSCEVCRDTTTCKTCKSKDVYTNRESCYGDNKKIWSENVCACQAVAFNINIG